MKIYNYIALWIGLLTASTASIAQQTLSVGQNTVSAIEHWKQYALWKNTNNAAGFFLDNPINYSQAEINALFYAGTFKRPQQPDHGNQQNVYVEGNYFTNGFMFSGQFDYTRDILHDVNFNATLADPYRGMPYFIADLNPSKWVNQHYDMSFQITSPQFSRFRAGLDFNYRASSAMKQRDIRNENYFYQITLKPSLLYSINDNNHLGANFLFSNLKEETVNSNHNIYFDQTYFQVMGLGHAIESVGSGQNVQYDGNTVGGGLQYHHQGTWDIFLVGNYAIGTEDAHVAFINPMAMGTALRKIWDTELTLQSNKKRIGHRIDLKYQNSSIDGIEHVVQRQGTTAVSQWVTVAELLRSNYANARISGDYKLIANKNNEIAWAVSSGVSYDKLDDQYYMPVSLKNTENMQYKAGASYTFPLKGGLKNQLILRMNYLYNDNLSGKYQFGGEKSTPIAEQMEVADLNYLTSDYSEVNIPVVYSQQFSPDSKSQFYIKGVCRFIKSQHTANDLRHYVGIGFGANL